MSIGEQDQREVVQSITSAPEPLWVDVQRRQRRYLGQMAVRSACFLAAALTWNHVPVLVSLVFIVLATVLPYVAVLLANAGRERGPGAGPMPVVPRELGAGAGPVGPLGPGR